MSFKELDKKAQQIALNYRCCERELVAIISRIDQSKAFYKLGHSSLFSYMTKHLGLSEAVACNISAVIRKSYEVPELQKQVVSGEISLNKARKLTPVINTANQKSWFRIAKSKTQRQIEREVSLAQPKAAVVEKASYVSAEKAIHEKVEIKQKVPRIKLELGVSEKLMIQLRRCQDLESQRQKKSVSLEGCLEELVNLYLDKRDPVKRAERQKIRGRIDAAPSVSDRAFAGRSQKTPSQRSANATSKAKGRKAIPMAVRHQVQLRDQGRCSHIDHNGARCPSRRHLEIHHIKPVCEGGGNELSNLKLLCYGHHVIQHLEK